jgi:CDGSH-type Zn-finger protein/uncharacterized Fe-S cluster protein YjdI
MCGNEWHNDFAVTGRTVGMDEDIHEYESEDVTVSFDSNRCIHARECVRGIPTVFDADRRPWIDPEAADAEAIAAVVERCPTGALQYERHDGGPVEEPPARNTVTVVEDGPLYLRGDIALESPDGETVLTDTRIGLCRCGHSENKPLCDNSHERVFEATGTPPETAAVVGETDEADGPPDDEGPAERLTVQLSADGPFVLDGPYDLRARAGDRETREDGALCRCGESGTKPFCDGTHATVGFTTGPDE